MNAKKLILTALICLATTTPLQSRSYLETMCTNHRMSAHGKFGLSLEDRRDIAETKATTYAFGAMGFIGSIAYLIKNRKANPPLTLNKRIAAYTALGLGLVSLVKFNQVHTEADNLERMVAQKEKAQNPPATRNRLVQAQAFQPTTVAQGWQLVREIKNFRRIFQHPQFYFSRDINNRIHNIINEYANSEAFKALNRAKTGEGIPGLAPILTNIEPYLADEKTQIILALYDAIVDTHDNLDATQEDASHVASFIQVHIRFYARNLGLMALLYKAMDKNHPLFNHE